MPDGRCCSCSERQHMLTMRPLDAHGKWQGKTQKEYLCRKADEERGFTAQEFLQAKADGWEEQFKYRNTAACRRGLRQHRPPASRGGGAARSSRKRRNLGVKTRCVRVGTARSNCWLARSVGGCREPRTERKAAACPRHPSTAEIYRQIQTTATVDDILFSKAEQRAEQITQTPVTMLFSLGNQQNLHAELLHRKIRCCGKHPIGQAVLKPAAV